MSIQTSYMIEKQILETFPSEKIEFYRTDRRGKVYAKFYNMKSSKKKCLKDDSFPKADQISSTSSTLKFSKYIQQ